MLIRITELVRILIDLITTAQEGTTILILEELEQSTGGDRYFSSFRLRKPRNLQ